MLIIQPIGGLCNRMRSINSALELAQERGDSLTVIWFNNKELNCPYHKLFQKNKYFRVINISSKWNIIKLFYQFTCHFLNNEQIRSHKTVDGLDPTFKKTLKKRCYIATEESFSGNISYDYFVPISDLQKRIHSFTQKLGDFSIGVHIRRTDNNPSIGTSTTEAFILAMKEELSLHQDTRFYLATDDLNEEQKLRTLFPNHIISNESKDLSRNSVSGIQDALLDLYILASTKKIIGSYYSSFTDIASELYKIPKIIAMQTPKNTP